MARRPTKPKPWTERELMILNEFYPTSTQTIILKLLPGRSKQAIYATVRKLRIFRKYRSNSRIGENLR